MIRYWAPVPCPRAGTENIINNEISTIVLLIVPLSNFNEKETYVNGYDFHFPGLDYPGNMSIIEGCVLQIKQ
jgi:hypothetical protein